MAGQQKYDRENKLNYNDMNEGTLYILHQLSLFNVILDAKTGFVSFLIFTLL